MEISLDIILKGFKKQCEKFNPDKFFDKCKKEYPILNKGYEFIEPYNISSRLEQGDIIRYIKNIGQPINSPCFILKIKYAGEGTETIQGKTFVDTQKCYIEYIETKLLRNTGGEKGVDKLRLYPESYFFFKLIEKKGTNSKKIRELIKDEEIIFRPFKKSIMDTDDPFLEEDDDNNIDNLMANVKDIIKKSTKKQ
jgi:hypothetical protein